jgi:hypothetical protein
MMRASKQWDIRCPQALVRLFPVRRGYYYKVDRRQARRIVAALSKAYGVSVPVVLDVTPVGCNGWYQPASGTMAVHARGHMKTVFHEWYHHLDAVTHGKYDSSDRKQLAWQFADRLFDVLRVTKS